MKTPREQVTKYRDYLLGIVSDVEFQRDGELRPKAGFELARMVCDLVPDVPIVLQSSHTKHQIAGACGRIFVSAKAFAHFAGRSAAYSDRAIFAWRFCLPSAGRQRSRARRRSQRAGGAVARRSGGEHRLSCRAQPLFPLADGKNRGRAGGEAAGRARSPISQPSKTCATTCSIPSPNIAASRAEVLIGDFDRTTLQVADAFLSADWAAARWAARRAAWPSSAICCTTTRWRTAFPESESPCPRRSFWPPICSTEFLHENNLADFALNSTDEAEIEKRFLAAALPAGLQEDLTKFLEEVRYPARRALFQPAGRFAIPAFHRRLRDLHAGQPGSRHRGADRSS